MHKSPDEKKIVQLIKRLPLVTDQRPNEEIFHQVKRNLKRKPAKKRRFVFIPTLTSLAIILIILIVLPFIGRENGAHNKIEISSDEEIHSYSEPVKQDKVTKNKFNNDKSSSTVQNSEKTDKTSHIRTAIYKEDIQSQKIFTYASYTNDGGLVPVVISIIQPNETEGNWFEKYKMLAKDIQILAPNLMNVKPFIDSIMLVNPTTAQFVINDKFRENFTYQNGLQEFIQNTFQYTDIKRVQFTDQDGNPVEFGSYGVLQEQHILKQPRRAQYLYQTDNGDFYIVANSNTTSANLNATLHEMQESPNDFFQPLILNNIDLEVVHKEGDETAKILFAQPLDLTKGDLKRNMMMVEGILLAAKEYGVQSVQFEGISPVQWEGFDFGRPVEVPIAPNYLK